MIQATPIHAALLAALFLVLTVRTIRARQARRVLLGTGGDAELERRMRAHANCAEYAPFGLLLMLLVELQGLPVLAVHALGLLLVSGRVLHAASLWRPGPGLALRTAGMGLTLTAIAAAAVLAAGLALA